MQSNTADFVRTALTRKGRWGIAEIAFWLSGLRRPSETDPREPWDGSMVRVLPIFVHPAVHLVAVLEVLVSLVHAVADAVRGVDPAQPVLGRHAIYSFASDVNCSASILRDSSTSSKGTVWYV